MKGVYLVTGTSGTGKSTILKQLQQKQYSTIGIDEEPGLVTWINKETGKTVPRGAELTEEFIAVHDWGCDIDKLKNVIATKDTPVIICGSCDNIQDVISLCEQSMILVCEPEVFLPRLEQRTDNEFGKNEAAQKAILSYYKKYREDCLKTGAISIDASQSIDDVVSDVIENVT